MKKLVSLALVAVLLCGAVAFADPSNIKIMNYSQGDLGGVYSDQIDRAIGSGGQLTGEPLPALPWQNSAQYGTFTTWLDRFLLDDPSAVTTVVPVVDLEDGSIANPFKLGEAKTAEELAKQIAFLIEWFEENGIVFDGSYITYIDKDGKEVKAAVDADGKVVAENIKEKNGVVVGEIGGKAVVLTDNETWKFEEYRYGASNPTQPLGDAVDFSKGVPANLKDGWYKDSTGKLYEVSKAGVVISTGFVIGNTYVRNTASGSNEKWDGSGWVANDGTALKPYLVAAADLNSQKKEGLYSTDGGATLVYGIPKSNGTMATAEAAAANAGWATITTAGVVVYYPGAANGAGAFGYNVTTSGGGTLIVKWDSSVAGPTTDPTTKGGWVVVGAQTVDGITYSDGQVVAR